MPLHKTMRGGLARARHRTTRLYRALEGRSAKRVRSMPITVDVRVFVADAKPFPANVSASLRQEKQKELERIFREQADVWSKETRHLSSITKMVAHPSYRRIMGMGPDALPLLLRELRERPDHWFIALNAITGEDPASSASTFHQTVDAWLSWGIQRGYLK
jgi:hypothetical protein